VAGALEGTRRVGPPGGQFLVRQEKVYVMDNHRLAPWCFWQRRGEATTWRLFHIDRHPDAADGEVNWSRVVRDEHRSDIAAYCEANIDGRELFIWDNIVQVAYRSESGAITDVYMSGVGDQRAATGVRRRCGCVESAPEARVHCVPQ
jgi:hypothetical protein